MIKDSGKTTGRHFLLSPSPHPKKDFILYTYPNITYIADIQILLEVIKNLYQVTWSCWTSRQKLANAKKDERYMINIFSM